MRKLPAAAALAALALAGSALAHHSFAMFDPSRTITVSGTVKEFQYTNPHSWLIVVAPGPDGKAAEWAFESEGPSTLLRNGVKRSMFAPGDKVTVQAWPMRDGRPAGALLSATRANGQLVHFRQGPPPPGVATGG
jgi:hypothetical protein